MNYIFHELIGKIVEIYIDDVVITFGGCEENSRVYPKTRVEDESKQVCLWSFSWRILGISGT
jgi:hypothetical protein